MSYLGDFFSGCTVSGTFTTVTTTGAPTAILSTAGSLCVVAYKMDPGATTGMSCTTAGITLATNCLGLTGVNVFSVNTNSDSTFYSCGKNYTLLLQGGLVGGTCVSGYVVGQFSLNNRSALRPLIHGRTLSVTSAGQAKVDSNIRTNQDLNCFSFLMTDSTNHNPCTVLSVTSQVSVDGANFTNTGNQPSHKANGIYLLDIEKADLNGCVVTFKFTATGGDDLFITMVPDIA